MRLSLLLGLGVGLAVFLSFAAGPSPQNVTISWNAPLNAGGVESVTNSGPYTNLVYRLKGTNDVTAPISTWPIILVVSNNPSSNLSVVIPITPGAWFFTVTASNKFWESDMTNTTFTVPINDNPRSSISKGP